MTDADYAGDQALLASTSAQAEVLRGICCFLNAQKIIHVL